MDNNKRKYWMLAPVRALILKVALVAVAVVAIVLIARHYIHKVSTTSTPAVIAKNEKIDITPLQIRSIEQIGEWSFLEINDEELVDTVRHGFFSDDKLVRIYYGTLRLGINLKEAHEGWLAFEGDTLCAVLPPIRLLDNNFIDEARTRSFIESGKWTHQDRKAMYDRAARMMRQRCLTRANYQTSRSNAKAQFEQMLRSMGYDKVKVE
ncbi:MAG: DUF4230 domain-containing protein [Prevotella sp.]|uniref:DUF4230 domain-containing protein n=1 Tax=Prevotella sp. TaxID=59823 RepID=UPI0025F2A33B|nr:DUF4230 domain-containing protein [Prevotella sp.]MCI7119202.1 DUF4230 domain-containing protein [Prevotella sp.]